MKILDSHFLLSATNINNCPPKLMSEVVFFGRSNVGKSSLINSILSKKNIAKSSQTPGKTQLINFFYTKWKKDESLAEFYFVDLPGFGYAKVSKSIKYEWNQNIMDFLERRDNIKLFIQLIDSRHTDLDIDKEVESYINKILRRDQKVLKVFTKIDKLSNEQNILLKRKHLDSIFTSNSTNAGIEELRESIYVASLGIKLE